MGDRETYEAATATEIGGITFLSPPTAVPSSQQHLLLNETAVRRSFNKTEKTTDRDWDKNKDCQDPRDAKKPAAVAATPKETGPTNQLKVLLADQIRQDKEMAAMRTASESQGAQIQQMLLILQQQATNVSEPIFSTDYRLPIPNNAPINEPTTAPNTEPITEPITEPTTKRLTGLARMGLLPDTEHEQMLH